MKQTIAQRRALVRAERRRSTCEQAYRATRSNSWLAKLKDAVTASLAVGMPKREIRRASAPIGAPGGGRSAR